MIVSCAPFRVSFAGAARTFRRSTAATAAPSYRVRDHQVFFAIIHPFFDSENFNLKYASTEVTNDVATIAHPILREVLRFLGISGGLEIASIADLPSGTGLGSSSSFCVAC